MYKTRITWFDKLLLKYLPTFVMRRFAKAIGIEKPVFEKAHEVFDGAERIDIFPVSNGRGFILVIDCKTALFFYQDGDRFAYDGYEMGKYNKGDVTVLDAIRRDVLMYP